jgi:uncharacterized protein (TIGR02246 family)
MSAEADVATRALYDRLIDAWNRRDATDFAGGFAPDGTMIGFDGSLASGPEIHEHLESVFADHPTAPYVVNVRGLRPLGADAAILRAIAGMVPPGQDSVNPDANAHHTMIAERGDGGWKVVLFQNTPAQYHGRPELVERHTAEIEALR